MNLPLRQRMTLDQFLAWELRQELRYEFDGAQPVAMTGGTAAHAAIQRNLLAALTVRLRAGPCQPFGSELKVRVAGDRIRYPDAFVICTPIAPSARIVTDPVVVFEVLSDTTAADDLVVKNGEYRDTPSIGRYVVLQQNSAAAIVFAHRAGEWATELVAGENAILPLPEIGISIPLEEIYAGLDFRPGEEPPMPESGGSR